MDFKSFFNHFHTQLTQANSNKNNLQITEYQSTKDPVINPIIQPINYIDEYDSNNMAKDLMYLVGTSIEDWAKKYGMENLPKKVVFHQALSIMNSFEKICFNEQSDL